MKILFLSTPAARLAALAALTLMLSPLFPPGFVAAHAQSPTPPSQSTPPPAAASQPAASVFRSAFEGYQPYTEQKMAPWKQANENVGQIGGWREYAREASQPNTPAAPAKATEPTNPKAGGTKP